VEFFIENFEDVEQILDRFMTRVWYAAQRNNLTLYRYRYEYAVEAGDKADSASSKLVKSLHSIRGFMPLAREPKNLDDLTKGTILQKFVRERKSSGRASLVMLCTLSLRVKLRSQSQTSLVWSWM
jgi:hypothetical protein